MSDNPFLGILAKLETAGGAKTIKSPEGVDSFNLYNIKARPGEPGFRAKDKEEGSNDLYRSFANTAEADAAAIELIGRRYPRAKAAMDQPFDANSVAEFALGLKAKGYATDPDYVSKLQRVAGFKPQVAVPAPMQARAVELAKFDALLGSAMGSLLMHPAEASTYEQKLREADKQATDAEAARPNALERFGGAMAGSTGYKIITGIRDKIMAPKFTDDPTYVPAKEGLPVGADADLNDDYFSSKSAAEAQDHITKWEDERLRVGTVMDAGVGKGIAMSFAAEIDPVNLTVGAWAVPAALAKIGLGSVILAKAGRTGASIVSSIGENLVGGTGLEAIRQGLEGHMNVGDLAISAAADVFLGAGAGMWGAHSIAKAATIRDAHIEGAIAREMALLEKARTEVGPNATAGELRAQMDRTYATDLYQRVQDMVSPSKHPDALPGRVEGVPVDQAVMDTPTARFQGSTSLAEQEAHFLPGGKFAEEIPRFTGGKYTTLAEMNSLPAGVHFTGKVPRELTATAEAATRLANQFLPDHAVTVTFERIPLKDGRFANGMVGQVSDKASMIVIDPTLPPAQAIRSLAHEVGHVIFNRNISKLEIRELKGLQRAFREFTGEVAGTARDGNKARAMRYSVLNSEQFPTKELTTKPKGGYELNFDEFGAEQFVKYIEKDPTRFGFTEKVVNILKEALARVMAYLSKAKREVPQVDDRFASFFDSVLNKAAMKGGQKLPSGPMQLAQQDIASDVVAEIGTAPLAAEIGLTGAPMGTPRDRADAQAILALHKQAEAFAIAHPKNEKALKNLADNTVFNVASNGLLMLKSNSALLRSIASKLVEDASGAGGVRKDTAAISKYMQERLMKGNVENDITRSFELWRKGKPGAGLKDDLMGGRYWTEFNKALAEEIEARRTTTSGSVTQDPHVSGAVDSIEAAYQRIANEQRKVGTIGSGGLAPTSRGYMPHRMSSIGVINMTNAQRQVLHDALVDQFVTISGWDMSFSDALAANYINIVRNKASGGHSATLGGQGAASEVAEALQAMNLPADIIDNHMANFQKGAANFTKKRLELDLLKSYVTPDGSFRLIDLMDTDQVALVRAQAGRASGEVALAKYGVQGKPGLDLLRKALQYGRDGERATLPELDAFDQMAAEFLNEPYGTAAGKFMDRAMQANSAVRLGGIFFNQLAEFINAIPHIGAVRTLESIGSLKRLRSEIIAKSKGQVVNNSILDSIEIAGGAEFGTDSYKHVMPYDNPNNLYPAYGKDTLTLTDRLLRGAGHLQGVLSGWRMIHSAQQRGIAEQIVHKALRYIREGKEDIALNQMGFTPQVQQAIRNDLAQVATFVDGRLTKFDVTKITDPVMREQFIQSVHRGTKQIIQDTFIGERGKWMHDGWMKMLTQFRGFGLTSMEKQWGRQRNSRGAFQAGMLTLGSMSLAAPIYMARVYAASIGRPDQEKYVADRLTPDAIARATANYVATTGMAGDFMDALTSVLPESMGVKPTGGRIGSESNFVGNFVLPASSLVDDVWKYAQKPDDIGSAVKVLPFSRIPAVIPFLNGLKQVQEGGAP